MSTQVDPYAFSNAFNAQLDRGRQNRLDKLGQEQMQLDNNRNALHDMYTGQDRSREQEDREQQAMSQKRQMLFSAAESVVKSQDPIAQTRALMPQLQQLGIEGLNPAALDGANPDEVRATAKQIYDGLAPFVQQQTDDNGLVQSAQILDNGNIAFLTRDGRLVDTGKKAKEQFQIVQMEGAPARVNLRTADSKQLTTPEQERAAAAAQAGAVSGATAQANANVAQATTQKQNDNAYRAYTAAMQGLSKAMGNTDTGPIAGRLPAVTAAQQIAEGSVAALAPILKQLFRASGEGVFTDKDQQLLLEMVPTRKDHPEARAAKVEMINKIVGAKLGIGGPPPNTAPPSPNRIKVDAQGNVIGN